METKSIAANNVKKGTTIILEGSACRVVDVEISRPGKHGHSKVRISAIGLMDDKKRVVVMPGHDDLDVPIIEKRTAQVLSVQGDVANVMDTESYENFELKIPDELKEGLVEGSTVLYWIIMNEKVMKQVRGKD